jgi:hypothetical protein
MIPLMAGAPNPQQHRKHPQHSMAEEHAYMSTMHVCWHLSSPGLVTPASSGPSALTTQASYLPQHPPQQWQHPAMQQIASPNMNAPHAVNTVQQSTSVVGNGGFSMTLSATGTGTGTILFVCMVVYFIKVDTTK